MYRQSLYSHLMNFSVNQCIQIKQRKLMLTREEINSRIEYSRPVCTIDNTHRVCLLGCFSCIYLRRYVLPGVRPFLCLSVSRITQKVIDSWTHGTFSYLFIYLLSTLLLLLLLTLLFYLHFTFTLTFVLHPWSRL